MFYQALLDVRNNAEATRIEKELRQEYGDDCQIEVDASSVDWLYGTAEVTITTAEGEKITKTTGLSEFGKKVSVLSHIL